MTNEPITHTESGPGRPQTLKAHALRRRALRDETRREIEQIAAQFYARRPREECNSIGSIYARYSSRHQSSVIDQIRACFENAERHGVFVPTEHVYFDLATRGAKRQREGLLALQEAIETKAFQVLFVFTTNRLHRKTHRSLQFVEEEIVERGLRAIFVRTGIDTADVDRWKYLMGFNATIDEFVVSMYADNVRAAHEGLFDRRLVFGTISFGYTGEPIPGEFTKQKRPRRRLIVDPVTSRWVKQIFIWFVEEKLSIEGIVRRLNAEPQIPLPPRCLTGAWSHRAVRLLLLNTRYRGYWEYGKTVTTWQSKKDYAKQDLREQPLRAEQLEELRIVADSLWHEAQVRLAELAATAAGRQPVDGNYQARPRLLNGLFFCPVHDRPLTVRGGYGHYMACPECQVLPDDSRALYTNLPRTRAMQQTCQKLAECVRGDADLVTTVIAACQAEADLAQRPDPAELDALHRRRDGLNRRIAFVLRNGGSTDEDQREAEETLKELRRERDEVQLTISRRKEDQDRPVVVPTENEVRALLVDLGEALEAAAASDQEQEIEAAREVIKALTGGRIYLEQIGSHIRHNGWLRGHFRSRLLPYLISRACGVAPAATDEQGSDVTIDYRAPTRPEELADEAKRLEDRGLLHHEIAQEMGITSKLVGKALTTYYARLGLERPDGRKRRTQLQRKQAKAPRYVQLADEVKRLRDSGLEARVVARHLQCDANMELKAWNHWHASRGLVPPKARKPQLFTAVGAVSPSEPIPQGSPES